MALSRPSLRFDPDDISPLCPLCLTRLERAAAVFARRTASEELGSFAPPGSLPAEGVAYTAMLSPLGLLWIAASPRGLLRVSSFSDEVAFCWELERKEGTAPRYQPGLLAWIVEQLEEYFTGRRTAFDLPLDLAASSPFNRRVLEAVHALPYGTVAGYGAVAEMVGRPRAARAVGTAMAGNPISIVVPCHRVIRSDGSIGEYARSSMGACGVHFKRLLLQVEGVFL